MGPLPDNSHPVHELAFKATSDDILHKLSPGDSLKQHVRDALGERGKVDFVEVRHFDGTCIVRVKAEQEAVTDMVRQLLQKGIAQIDVHEATR